MYFQITKTNDLYNYLRRRYILITPCKRSAARGRKEHPPPSELRSSSTPYGVVRERGDFSTPRYQYVSPFGDENEQLSMKITLSKESFIKKKMLIILYTNRCKYNISCCFLFIRELKRNAKH